MAPHITCQTILMPVTHSGVVEQGVLIFADDTLMAAVVCLQNSVDDPNLHGQWFLETGYGPCQVPPGDEHLFRSLQEAQTWVRERVSRTADQGGPQ